MFNWDNEKNQATFAACATPESFNAHLDAVNDEYFVACLDIGHAEMKGSGTNAVEMIRAIGDRQSMVYFFVNGEGVPMHHCKNAQNAEFINIPEERNVYKF